MKSPEEIAHLFVSMGEVYKDREHFNNYCLYNVDRIITEERQAVQELERQNKIMREALEFYADDQNWDWPVNGTEENSMVINDFSMVEGLCDMRGGKRARAALAKIQGE